MPTIADVERLAKQEFRLRTGIVVFDIPCRQLFEHSDRGTLKVAQGAELNRRKIANLALNFGDCNRTSSGVNLRDSLTQAEDGSTLVKATGSKLLSAVVLDGTSFRMTGHILYMDLKPKVLPDDAAEVFHTLNADFSKAIYLELICSAPNTGAATLLMLCLLKKLEGAKTGILADAVNGASDAFFKKMGFHHIRKANPSLWWMSRARAIELANKGNSPPGQQKGLMEHLRVPMQMQELCTRKGQIHSTSHKEFWDCR